MDRMPYSDRAEYFMAILIGICVGIGFFPENVLVYIQQFVASLGVI